MEFLCSGEMAPKMFPILGAFNVTTSIRVQILFWHMYNTKCPMCLQYKNIYLLIGTH